MQSNHIPVLAIYNLIACRLFSVARSARYERGRHLPPLCVPLRALWWGYDCFALRAMSLRDGIQLPYGDNLRRIMQSFVKLSMANTVV